MTRFLYRTVALFIVLAWTTTAYAQVRIERDVVYGMYSGLALLMNVHHPDRPNGFGILCVAGSGWNAPLEEDVPGLKDSPIVGDWSKTLTASGFTLFSINHRASPRFEYPAAVEDTQRAVRFIRANAKRFGINPDRIGAMGASSGAYLVSMVGVLDGAGAPDDLDPVNRLSSKVQSVVALFGLFDLKRVHTAEGGAVVALFLGLRPLGRSTPSSSLESKRYAAASPITYVTSDDPPFLLFHGDADETVPFKQSQLMEAALKKAGVPVTFVAVPGGRHGRNFRFGPDDPRLPDYVGRAAKWFDSTLRTLPPNCFEKDVHFAALHSHLSSSALVASPHLLLKP
jgi:acetyl esterase/lipase